MRSLPLFVLVTLILSSCSSLQPVTIHSGSGDHTFSVQLADTPDERARGLMNVSYLPDDRGMLFVFDEEGLPRFWMKDTLIPLDLIFISKKKGIVSIIEEAKPEPGPDYTIHGPKEPVLYVLELKGGASAKLGFKKGDKVSFAYAN